MVWRAEGEERCGTTLGNFPDRLAHSSPAHPCPLSEARGPAKDLEQNTHPSIALGRDWAQRSGGSRSRIYHFVLGSVSSWQIGALSQSSSLLSNGK